MSYFNTILTLITTAFLTHSFPMHLFSISWKYQKKHEWVYFNTIMIIENSRKPCGMYIFRGYRKGALGANGYNKTKNANQRLEDICFYQRLWDFKNQFAVVKPISSYFWGGSLIHAMLIITNEIFLVWLVEWSLTSLSVRRARSEIWSSNLYFVLFT